MDNDNDECLLFVDDSNVWIEAQKFAASGNSHMPKLTGRDHDPRLRINIGKLVNTLCSGRTQRQSYIYGSRPPPNDMVWKQYEKFKFQTKIYDRSSQGKEKEVDNSMSADMTEEAVDLRASAKYDKAAEETKKRTVFIVITGDRDMLPPIRKVLKCGIRVELWGWKSGMAKEYLKERNTNDCLSVNFLDNIFREVSFTNFRSTRTTRVVPAYTIVILKPEDLAEETWNDSFVARILLQSGRLFYTRLSKGGPEMIVEFPGVKNIEAIIIQARELFGEKTKIMSWPIYSSRFNKDISEVVETSNMFLPLENDSQSSSPPPSTKKESQSPPGNAPGVDEQSGDQEVQNLGRNPDDEEGWEQVKSRSPPGKAHGRAQRGTQRCPHGQHCGAGGECGYIHTNKEMARFRDYPTQNFKKWKTKTCTRIGCRMGERCPFAHSKEETWCLSCNDQGHLTDDCRS
ncbi:hypothetical protein QBC41DRAFT_61146 [Cercophora samala]|uniref:NYN domain-containing protein n=1 Tax=Cercophora samala TaxID=330535 RepID=A0AA39YJS3_9PEZI|nr:hypothetical protein QBC41DRAFT_61146 [Cercophora samala]